MTRNSAPQVFKGGWEQLENAVFTDNTNTISSSPLTFFIKPDGAAIFVISGTTVQTFPLSLPTWDLDSIQSVTNTFTITVDNDSTGLYFKDDGTKMYHLGRITDTLYEYVLPVPWDVSSIVDSPVSLSTSVVANPQQIAFSRDGDFVFIVNTDTLFSFPLPTAWDITSNVSNSSFTPTEIFNTSSVAFKTEGDKMYIGDAIVSATVVEYSLTAPFDISSPTATGNVLDINPSGFSPFDIFWRTTGEEFFVLDDNLSRIRKYHLDDVWDISTASYFSNVFDTSVPNRATSWRPDGLILYVLNNSTDRVTSYSTTTPFNLTDITFVADFSVNPQEINPQGMWWKNEGSRLYVIGIDNNTVFQYDASTDWSVASLSFSGTSFDIGFTDPTTGIYFTSDGLKMYISRITTDTIFQWDLSAPYVLPADFTSPTKSINTPLTSAVDLVVKPDGTQVFFVASSPNDEVVRYTFGTPFEIDTITIQDSLDISSIDSNPNGLYIRPNDGKQLFVCGTSNQTVASFDMSLEFNNNLITILGDELITNLGENLAA